MAATSDGGSIRRLMWQPLLSRPAPPTPRTSTSASAFQANSLVTYGAVGILLASMFVPMSLFRLIDADEGTYLLVSKLVMDGKLPYHDFFYPQMPLLPYVYGLWMTVFGPSWYAARLLSSFFAITLGLLLYHHVIRQTHERALGLLAIVLFTFSSLVLEWYSVVKPYAFSTLMLFSAYAVLFSRFARWKYFFSGLLLGLAVDARLYLVAVVPAIVFEAFRREATPRARCAQLARFGIGLIIALLPNEFFFLIDPDTYMFNIIGVHAIRSGPDQGLVANISQKVSLALQMLGINSTDGVTGFQLTCLLVLNVALVVSCLMLREQLPLAVVITALLVLASLLPTPTYAQYFCIVVPFLVVNATLLIARLGYGAAPPRADGARRTLNHLLVSLVVLYVLASPFDVYRYIRAGDGVPGVYTHRNAINWRIGTIREVSRLIDQEAREATDVALSWWPGYFIESKTSILPKLENHIARLLSPMLSRAELAKYNFMSNDELLSNIVERRVPIVVLGNWVFAAKPLYREALLHSGYVLTQTIGDTEIYRWRPSAR